MAFEIRETKSDERIKSSWNEIVLSLEPLIDTLENEEDRRYFKSKIKLLIGKDIRLSNIPEKHIYIYISRVDYIFTLTWYPMMIPDEYINKEIARYLNRLGIRISEEGLGWKFGPMGFQQQTVKQEIKGVEKE